LGPNGKLRSTQPMQSMIHHALCEAHDTANTAIQPLFFIYSVALKRQTQTQDGKRARAMAAKRRLNPEPPTGSCRLLEMRMSASEMGSRRLPRYVDATDGTRSSSNAQTLTHRPALVVGAIAPGGQRIMDISQEAAEPQSLRDHMTAGCLAVATSHPVQPLDHCQ
jgi:hypothetical protein